MNTTRPEILIVDEDGDVRRMLATLFLSHGITAHLASSGKAAVDVYSRHRDTIRGVLIDVPRSVWDGAETLTSLHAINPDLPCCFMSGDSAVHTSADLAQLGAVHLYRKPFCDVTHFVTSLKAVFQMSH